MTSATGAHRCTAPSDTAASGPTHWLTICAASQACCGTARNSASWAARLAAARRGAAPAALLYASSSSSAWDGGGPRARGGGGEGRGARGSLAARVRHSQVGLRLH